MTVTCLRFERTLHMTNTVAKKTTESSRHRVTDKHSTIPQHLFASAI